jgi:phospholipase C
LATHNVRPFSYSPHTGTIFDDFFDAGLDFGIFYRDFPASLILDRVRLYPMYIKFFDDFLAQAANGTLPAFSFLEPRYFDFLLWVTSLFLLSLCPCVAKTAKFEEDEHPHYEPDLLTGDVAYGEFLIKLVYDTLRHSPQWEQTLFIVTYDEHGGFYDHVPPPQDGIPNPDGLNTTNPVISLCLTVSRVLSTLLGWACVFPSSPSPHGHRKAWSCTSHRLVSV